MSLVRSEAEFGTEEDLSILDPLSSILLFFGDRLMVGRQSLKLLMKVRLLLPEPRDLGRVEKKTHSGVV